jgi:crotonobetainyl-CoA:carnitine CoA-transferase CaiB-like acyl-CoA transferase
MMRALDDLRVLDLSGAVAGPFCTKMFADFGADVIKLEPREGEAGRNLPPFVSALTPDPSPNAGRGEPNSTEDYQFSPSPSIGRGGRGVRADGEGTGPLSAFFLYLNTSKRSVVLDVMTPEGSDVFRRLVRDADVVVESFPPGTMERLGLGLSELEALRPGIILTSITPFGQTGPWRDAPINDLVASALSGWASVNGRPDREPLKPTGYQASFQAGIAAYLATMSAVVHRDRTGEGQHVDISILEPSVASFAPALTTTQYRGEPPKQQAGSFQRGPVPAADGYFSLTLSRAHFWRDAMVELGLPELGHDERFHEASYRQAHAGEFAPLIESRIAARGKRELFEALGTLRVVGGMVLTTEELFEDPHVRARDFLVPLEHPEADSLEYPGAPFKMSLTPWSPSGAAPRLGEHTEAVLREAGLSVEEIERLQTAGVA